MIDNVLINIDMMKPKKDAQPSEGMLSVRFVRICKTYMDIESTTWNGASELL